MNSSGNTTMSAPWRAASSRARRTLAVLLAMSPTVELSWAQAIASRSAGFPFEERVFMTDDLSPALADHNQGARISPLPPRAHALGGKEKLRAPPPPVAAGPPAPCAAGRP